LDEYGGDPEVEEERSEMKKKRSEMTQEEREVQEAADKIAAVSGEMARGCKSFIILIAVIVFIVTVAIVVLFLWLDSLP
jgi:cell division protein FtsL